MKRITLVFLLTMFAIGAYANRSYKIDRWYTVSKYIRDFDAKYYLGRDFIKFELSGVWDGYGSLSFTLYGVEQDDFRYMVHEKETSVDEKIAFINDYLAWMVKNNPDYSEINNFYERGVIHCLQPNAKKKWKSDYRKYMIERGWYKNEDNTPVVQYNQAADRKLDPQSNYVPMVETVTKKPDQDTKPAQEKKTVNTSPSNNAKTTSSKPSSSVKSSAMSSSSGSTSSSTSNKSSASSKENSGEEGGNSVAAWAIIIGGLYYMFGRDKKKGSKTVEQLKKEEEKRKKEKRQREAAARRRKEERERQEKERKYMEDCYYEEWLKKNQSGWRG